MRRIPLPLTYDQSKRLGRRILIVTVIVVGSAIVVIAIAANSPTWVSLRDWDWRYDKETNTYSSRF